MRVFLFAIALIILAASGAMKPADASAPGPSYLVVTSFDVDVQNTNIAKLSLETESEIPKRPDPFIGGNPVVGLVWADLDTGKVFVVTIHPVLGRDSQQRPDGWHAHTATLGGGATLPHDFCLVSIDSTPATGIRMDDNLVAVNVAKSKLPVAPPDFDVGAGFTIQPDTACGSGLSVQIVVNDCIDFHPWPPCTPS